MTNRSNMTHSSSQRNFKTETSTEQSIINKRQRKPKELSRMDNPETSAMLGTQTQDIDTLKQMY